MKPIIITIAGTGGKWTKDDSPYVPMSPEEIVRDAAACFSLGASMFHIHARMDDGTPTFAPEYFERIIPAMRKECPGVIIQMSTGNMEGQVKEKLEPLMRLRPDLASFNLKGCDEEVHYMAEVMEQYGVKPAVECFTEDMLSRAKELLDRGVLKLPIFVECVFDLLDTEEPFSTKAAKLLFLEKNFPEGTVWSQTRGFYDQRALQAMSAALGGNIRTGLEDNLFLEKGVFAESSAVLIEKAILIAKTMGRKIASVSESRQMLGLKEEG